VKNSRNKSSLRSNSLSEKNRIYSELRKEILTLSLPPRELLVESALARRFEVSKAPVREALAVLQRDGLVEALPRKGYLVTPITVGDLHELFELRVALEGTAAELAATKITDEELEYIESLRPPPSAKPGLGLNNFLDYNRKFHLAVARASRNRRLLQLIEQTNEQMGRAIAASYQIGEHSKIIKALRSRKPEQARLMMVQHIQNAESRALNWSMSEISAHRIEAIRLIR
jgi:DNA-binding GntR family transcriptional regulator